jgi:hypothetical protein
LSEKSSSTPIILLKIIQIAETIFPAMLFGKFARFETGRFLRAFHACYKVRLRNDKRGAALIFDALPFGAARPVVLILWVR